MAMAACSSYVSPRGEEAVECETTLLRVGAEPRRCLDMARVQHAAIVEDEPATLRRDRADAEEVFVRTEHVAGLDTMALCELLGRQRARVAEQLGDVLGRARRRIEARAAEALVLEE